MTKCYISLKFNEENNMKSWATILSAIGLIILTGCASTLPSMEVQQDEKSLKEKAVVVIGARAPYTNLWGPTVANVSSVWVSKDGSQREYQFTTPGIFSQYRPNSAHEYMIEPGTYELKNLTFKTRDTANTLTFARPSNITFTAQAGDLVYVGDVEVTGTDNNDYALKLADKYEEAAQHVKETLPKLRKPLEKRLIQGLAGWK
jgi:hypothetical protein